ncbi:MAG: DUF3284 domain-containing protein [Erysipelotrichaceae bacterium]|nr:DUF3284 domain-containing protein [Erysipelotrichaceae bacterium]
MEYKGILKVNAHDLYETLLESVRLDAGEKTGREIDKRTVEKGMRYKTQRQYKGKMVDAYVDIKSPVKDKRIEIDYSAQGMNYAMIYDIVSIDERNCELTYNENGDLESVSALQRFVFNSKNKKRFKEIEKYIINNKKEKKNEA